MLVNRTLLWHENGKKIRSNLACHQGTVHLLWGWHGGQFHSVWHRHRHLLLSNRFVHQTCYFQMSSNQFSIMQYRHRHILLYNRFVKTYHLWLSLLLSNVIKSSITLWVIQTNPLFIPVKFASNVYSSMHCKDLQSNIWSARLLALPLSIFGFPVSSLCKILNQYFIFYPVFVWYFCGSEDKGTIWFPSEGKLNSLWPNNLQSLCSSKENKYFTLCNMFLSSIFCSLFRFEMIWT